MPQDDRSKSPVYRWGESGSRSSVDYGFAPVTGCTCRYRFLGGQTCSQPFNTKPRFQFLLSVLCLSCFSHWMAKHIVIKHLLPDWCQSVVKLYFLPIGITCHSVAADGEEHAHSLSSTTKPDERSTESGTICRYMCCRQMCNLSVITFVAADYVEHSKHLSSHSRSDAHSLSSTKTDESSKMDESSTETGNICRLMCCRFCSLIGANQWSNFLFWKCVTSRWSHLLLQILYTIRNICQVTQGVTRSPIQIFEEHVLSWPDCWLQKRCRT